MKRSCKLLVNASKLQTERDKAFAENQEKMLSMIQDLQSTVLRLSSNADMRKKIKIDDYFPIRVDSDMQRFLSKDDGLFDVKREEFENMLYCHVTKNVKLKRPFETKLLETLFSREYISSHKWPGGPRYTFVLDHV